MKKAAILAAPLAVLLIFPLLAVVVVAGLGGLARACTPQTGPARSAFGGGDGLRIGTLNWRGASHFHRNPHPGEQPFWMRVPHMIAAIDRSGASIVGFQEFEPPQAAEFTRQARRWGLVRGRTRGHPDSRDAIAYLRSRWTPVLRRYVRIRYAGGHVGVPLVQLASTSGPGSVWVLNTHNPANAVGGSGRIRDAAVAAEAAALNQVVAANPGARAFLTGDMNDHARFRREFTAHAAGWTPANRNAGQIDWIVGSPGVGFTRVVVDTATNDHAHHYTDHPFVYATVAGDATGPGSRNPGSPISGVGRAGLAADHPAPAASTTTSTRSSPAGPPRGGGVNQAGGGYRIGRWTLNAEQFHNAQQLVASADARGGTDAAVVITTAALTESGLRTDPGTTGGAYGVLQQTPTAGWGTQAQVMNVAYAANGFLDHLARVPGWRSMPPWRAAQAVQRSGAGQASDGRATYGRHVAEARAIVAVLAGTPVPAATPTCTATAATSGGDTSEAQRHGPFTPNTQLAYVGPYGPDTLAARMRRFSAANGATNVDPFFGTEPDGSWYRDCQHFVANLDGRAASGYASAQAAWAHFRTTGAAHPAAGPDGMSPPAGAWLYYGPDHVAVYLGNNLVASTDVWGNGTAKVGPASDLTDGRWHLPYLGWVAPWGATAAKPAAGT